jgi:hypothetical protein
MRIETRVIPVEGISPVPGISDDGEAEIRQQTRELQLLKIATGLSVLLVACAWIAIAFD